MQPSYKNFNRQTYNWHTDINYREHPELYKVGKGEQGVLICEPYKSELVSLWRFKTPDIARKSSELLYQKFLDYLARRDFVGADMARKFLQMGYTRARRYTNYKGGLKYNKENGELLARGTGDPEKAKSAAIFYEMWQLAEANAIYQQEKQMWKRQFG